MATERILLLMDNRGDSNWGSQATTTMLVGLLQERFPGAEIRGVPRSACRPRNGLVRSLATSLVQQGSEWAVQALTKKWHDDFEWADLVVVNGEGTLHPQPQAFRWVCSISALARKSNKPYWVVNCSVQCKGDRAQPHFEAFFRGSQHLAVREGVSHRELATMGISATLAADCAFIAEAAPDTEIQGILKNVGVEKPFAVMTGSASVKRWPVEHQREVIAALQRRGLSVLYTHSDEKDVRNLSLLGGGIPVVSHTEASFRQLISIQAKAEILVGGRFHPTIFAVTSGTPFVALQSNTHKMSGLVEMLGAKELLFEFSDLKGVIPKINDVLDHREAWSHTLKSAAEPLKCQARKNVLGLNEVS